MLINRHCHYWNINILWCTATIGTSRTPAKRVMLINRHCHYWNINILCYTAAIDKIRTLIKWVMLIKKHFIFSIKQLISKSLMPTSRKHKTSNLKPFIIRRRTNRKISPFIAQTTCRNITFYNFKPGGILESHCLLKG